MLGSKDELEGLDLEEYLNRGDNDACKDREDGVMREDELMYA